MFIGRRDELSRLKKQLSSEKRTAVLVYGKRRVGKSTLLREAAGFFDGVVINHLCVQSSYEGNLELLCKSVCMALGIPQMKYGHIYDLFDFLERQNQNILLILDEYQYMKSSLKKNEMDSYMQSVIDRLSPRVKVVLCGSYISIMKELLQESNPLFGRFTLIEHIEEFDYYDAAKFYEPLSVREKIQYYSVFGGSPYVLDSLEGSCSLKENICERLIPETSLFRTYIENVIIKEIQKAFDIRILEALGNGKKKYSEIASILGGEKNGLLDKQLKNLVNMETIQQVYPINKKKDRKKHFYEITDNLMRFYFTFIFGNNQVIEGLGPDVFFDEYVLPKINAYTSRRYEDLVKEYFRRMVRSGKISGVTNIGTYWYDDPKKKVNGEFDVVLETRSGYRIYECKYYDRPLSEEECRSEEKQVRAISDLLIDRLGFVSLSGFDFESENFELITAKEIYE